MRMEHYAKAAFFFLFLALISCYFLVTSTTSATADQNCITSGCHAGMLKSATVHAVAETCDTCHQSTGSTHPLKGVKTFKLVEAEGTLCASCHPDIASKQHTHSPVKEGQCTSCHDPHESAQPKLLLQPMKELCLSCHPDKTGMEFMHGPTAAGDCTACHSPHGSDHSAMTLAEQPELCFVCHEDIKSDVTNKKVHHPALEGGCTSCHNPHGSSYKRLLPASGADVCFQCHPEMKEKIAKAKTVHPPIKSEKACVSCHNPHASDGEKLLEKSGMDLCLECHKKVIDLSKMTVLHRPVKDGKCTACHDAHASPFSRLLVKSFPDDFYAAYSDAQYELCFSCHNRDMVRFPDTSFATGFRDGDKNLHYVHVNRKEKGRSCKTCHSPHGGTLPKLLVDKVPFGKWELPLNYVKTDTGGGCTPGCHKKVTYDRKNPSQDAVSQKPPVEEGKDEKKSP